MFVLTYRGVAKARTWPHSDQRLEPILLNEVQCTGNELSLEECPYNWEQQNCDHMEIAGVTCNPYTGQSQQRKNTLTQTYILDNTVVITVGINWPILRPTWWRVQEEKHKNSKISTFVIFAEILYEPESLWYLGMLNQRQFDLLCIHYISIYLALCSHWHVCRSSCVGLDTTSTLWQGWPETSITLLNNLSWIVYFCLQKLPEESTSLCWAMHALFAVC